MAYNRIQAARLLAASELPVFEASLGESLAALQAARLNALIKRARTMRDKAQDLLQRQRVATRARTGSKAGASGDANARTAQKVQALDEALKRFEKRLTQVEAATQRTAVAAQRERERAAAAKLRGRPGSARPLPAGAPALPARSTKAPKGSPRAAGKALPSSSTGARARDAAQQRKFTGSQAIQAHVGASGRRQQAKRDGRG